MAEPQNPKLTDFSRGANNRTSRGHLPAGFYRESVNLDPLNGGNLALRAGYERRYAGTAVRGLLTLDNKALIADGTDLVEFDLNTNSSTVIRQIAPSGVFTGCVFNDELFFCTATEALRYKNGVVRAWGVPPVTSQPPAVGGAGGALLAGVYKYAITRVVDGEEGGTAAAKIVAVPANGKITLTLPTGTHRLYVGHVNSTEMYLQLANTGAVSVSALVDDTLALSTQFAVAPPANAQMIAAHPGVILLAVDKALWITHPLRPHLLYPARGFVQFAATIGMVASVAGGVYVSADHTYWLSSVAGKTPQQVQIHATRAVPGSATLLPDGSAAWFSENGLVVGAPAGAIKFLTEDNYVPLLTSRAASGLVEHDGNQMVVTTLRGLPKSNPLAISDYVDAEIVYP